jgi:hypothetical protein
VDSRNEIFPENLSPPSTIWNECEKFERRETPNTVAIRKRPESPTDTRTNENVDHPKLTKT